MAGARASDLFSWVKTAKALQTYEIYDLAVRRLWRDCAKSGSDVGKKIAAGPGRLDIIGVPSDGGGLARTLLYRSAMGHTFDMVQVTTKPTRQPKITSATLCRPCSTPVSLEWCVSPAAMTMAAVIGA